MSSAEAGPPVASVVAEELRGRVEPPWEVFGERAQHFEIHLNGPSVEMVRGPIALTGYGIRLFRPREKVMGVGFSAGSDTAPASIGRLVAGAEANARYSSFPSSGVNLPSGNGGAHPGAELIDRRLWADPTTALSDAVESLLHLLEGRPGIAPSFGSLRASLVHTSIANSTGLARSYEHTVVDSEVAVKAFGGPEGAAPGEYWVNRRDRQLPTEAFRGEVDGWCDRAERMRRADSPPNGAFPVVLPPPVLVDVLPAILGFRLSGAARLRKVAPAVGSRIGVDSLTISDDGQLPFGSGSAPFDDEGARTSRHPLIRAGVVAHLLYDALHSAAFDSPHTASAWRAPAFFSSWFHFPFAPQPACSNLVVEPGTGGSDAELIEGIDDGLWVDQLGYAFPDPLSGAFGGEIRAGYRIRNGKLAEPVRGGTVGGPLVAGEGEPSFLSSIGAIGSHPTLVADLVCPPIRFNGVSVAGA